MQWTIADETKAMESDKMLLINIKRRQASNTAPMAALEHRNIKTQELQCIDTNHCNLEEKACVSVSGTAAKPTNC